MNRNSKVHYCYLCPPGSESIAGITIDGSNVLAGPSSQTVGDWCVAGPARMKCMRPSAVTVHHARLARSASSAPGGSYPAKGVAQAEQGALAV